MKYSPIFVVLILLLTGCHPQSNLLEPKILYANPRSVVENTPSGFPPLSSEELVQDWGRELHLGIAFAREMDLYRAITCFKSALFLIPENETDRIIQIEYNILQAYYFGHKYFEAVETFEQGNLLNVPSSFPVIQDLLVMLYDSYLQINRPEKAYRILCLISSLDAEKAQDLVLEATIREGAIPAIQELIETHPKQEEVASFLADYQTHMKSVSKAQFFNAVLPGAGYYYVGQKKAAITSFVINALFTAAAYEFFDRGYIAAGLIVTSFELGWYIGGINGAGLAAKDFNQQLYETLGKEMLIRNRLFPALMIQTSF